MKKRIVSGKEIGAVIKRRRKELGISQEKLAEELGVTYQQVQRYENATNKLNVDNLQEIAMILRIPVTAFFESFKLSPEKPAPLDEAKLLRHFREIKDPGAKNVVIAVAKLASKR